MWSCIFLICKCVCAEFQTENIFDFVKIEAINPATFNLVTSHFKFIYYYGFILFIQCKKRLAVSRPQLGCHLPNSP
jgi:hypothetical protein